MKNLISMVDFVFYIDNNREFARNYDRILAYANFLKQPLELWMFVACYLRDGVWIPYTKDTLLNTVDLFNEWEQAKEICLFEGFTWKKAIFFEENKTLFWAGQLNGTIEDLVKYNLQLTPTALKQIGL